MIGRLDLITLVVDDVQLCAAFYREVLGFKPRGKFSNTYAEFENEGVRFNLIRRAFLPSHTGDDSHAAPRAGQAVELAIRLESQDEVKAVYQRAVELGATPISEPAMTPWDEFTAFIADPDGNVIALFCAG